MDFIGKILKWNRVAVTGIDKNDIVIVLIGPSGVGKSTFINTATNTKLLKVHSKLRPCTTEVAHVRWTPQSAGPDSSQSNCTGIVFVDTPEIPDSGDSKSVEQKIGEWLKRAFGEQVTVAGILYLHRITDNRLTDPPFRHYKMFEKLCGEQFRTRTLLVTTMWERENVATAEGRKVQLSRQWHTIKGGSGVVSHDGTNASAWRIVDQLLGEDVRLKLGG